MSDAMASGIIEVPGKGKKVRRVYFRGTYHPGLPNQHMLVYWKVDKGDQPGKWIGTVVVADDDREAPDGQEGWEVLAILWFPHATR